MGGARSNEPVILSEVRNCGRVEGSAAAFLKVGWSMHSRFAGSLKLAQALVLAVAICFSLGAGNPSGQLNDLDHRLMCTCGCAQILGECNHVGCTQSTQELTELRADIAAGMGDQQILSAFVAKYGATVLAAPPAHGFDLVAWIAPFAVFAAALLGTILLIRRWGGLGGKPQAAVATEPEVLDPEERERLERIRRETGSDGGF
jgi:cytochrome c-type biogenesis protein CcmH